MKYTLQILFLIFIIFIFLILNKIKKEYFTEIDKNKIKNTNYYFIHIPKNAGTSFAEKYCLKQPGHKKAKQFDIPKLKKSVAIIRNPYDRLISCYNYFKMDNTFWSKKEKKLPKYHEYCKKNSFNKFVDDLYDKKIEMDIHMEPQVNYLKKNNKIYTKLIRLENIEEDFFKIFKKKLDLPKINTSKKNNIKLTQDVKNKIFKIYEEDFKLLNYNK